jgi:hypothetical protein
MAVFDLQSATNKCDAFNQLEKEEEQVESEKNDI